MSNDHGSHVEHISSCGCVWYPCSVAMGLAPIQSPLRACDAGGQERIKLLRAVIQLYTVWGCLAVLD